jgi:FtsP/CotA-like multicopper oxidase with cupredoxin domain
MNRRNFLKLAGASSLALGWPSAIFAQEEKPTLLQAVKRVIDVNGKAANVFGITRDGNHPGLILDAGSTFDIALENRINEPTLIHWHGLTPPSEFDGVPDHPRPMLVPDERIGCTHILFKNKTCWRLR